MHEVMNNGFNGMSKRPALNKYRWFPEASRTDFWLNKLNIAAVKLLMGWNPECNSAH
jgi:hypothetical protein